MASRFQIAHDYIERQEEIFQPSRCHVSAFATQLIKFIILFENTIVIYRVVSSYSRRLMGEKRKAASSRVYVQRNY